MARETDSALPWDSRGPFCDSCTGDSFELEAPCGGGAVNLQASLGFEQPGQAGAVHGASSAVSSDCRGNEDEEGFKMLMENPAISSDVIREPNTNL